MSKNVIKGILHYNFIDEMYEVITGNNNIRHKMTSGKKLEVLNGQDWVLTTIEYNGRYYYSNNSVQIFEGQVVRLADK